MKTKKRIASKLFAALVVLTLISCCFLGTTFARYVTGDSNSANVNVATWKVDITDNGSDQLKETVMIFDELSPSMEEYSNEVRTNKTGKVLVATITVEEIDVDAKLTLTLNDIVVNLRSDAEEAEETNAESYAEEALSIKLYMNTDGGTSYIEMLTTGATTVDDSVVWAYADNAWTTTIADDTTATFYIFAEVTWTSDVGGVTGDNADARDTIIGKNVESVSWKLDYKAEQASQNPQA